MNFPEILKEIMFEIELSQTKLAVLIGVKQTSAWNWTIMPVASILTFYTI